MANLRLLNWNLEVRYFPHPHDAQGIRYELFFRYRDEPIILDELLKRSPKIWQDRTPGAFLAHESKGCSLVPILGEVLKTHQPRFWRPTDPDITMAIYPNRVFPNLTQEFVSDQRDVHPDEHPFSLVTIVDGYNIGNEFVYHGFGPGMVMVVKRPAVQEFYDELRAELEAFIEEYGPIGDSPEIKEDL